MRSLLRRLVPVCSAVLALSCGGGRGTIGALLGQQPNGRLFIRETPPRLAAAEKGLRPGDEVLLIDGRDVRTMDPRALHDALSGEVGSKVKLTAVRDERVIRVTLVRKPAPSPPKTAANVQ
jgi:C-terminal processing protease CtpA/Prc